MADKTAAEIAREICEAAHGVGVRHGVAGCECEAATRALVAYGEQERRGALQEAEAVALKLGGKSTHRHFAILVSDCIRVLATRKAP